MTRVTIDYRPALWGRTGIGRAVRELTRALGNAGGLDVHLFGHGLRPSRTAAAEVGRMHRMPLPGRALGSLAALGLDAARLAGNPDVFHWTDYVYPPVRRGRRAPRVVMTVHDVAFLEDDRHHGARASRRLAARFARAARRADVLVTPSRATAHAIERHAGTATSIRVVPFGADHATRLAPDPTDDRDLASRILGRQVPFVIAVGTIEPRKNHGVLLDAMQRLHASGHELGLVVAGGRGWLTDEVQARLAGEAGFPCAWIGSVADGELFRLVRAARALVYPSSLEGFGFPPLEALELGTPVVAGDCPALRENLGDAAALVGGTDAGALAEAISAACDDASLRSSQIEAWQRRRHRFRWSACAAAHAALYREVAGTEVVG